MTAQLTKADQDRAEEILISLLHAQGRTCQVAIAAYKVLRYFLGLDSQRPALKPGINDAAEGCARRAVLLALYTARKSGPPPALRRDGLAARILPDFPQTEKEVCFRDIEGRECWLQIV